MLCAAAASSSVTPSSCVVVFEPLWKEEKQFGAKFFPPPTLFQSLVSSSISIIFPFSFFLVPCVMMVATSREVLLSLVVEGGGSCVREEEQVRAHTSYIEEEEEEEEIHALLLETFTSVGSSPGAGETSREGIRNESGSNRELRDYFRMNRLCLRRLLRRLEISAHQEKKKKKKKRGPSPKVLGRTTDRYIITHCQPWFRHGTFVKSFVCFFFLLFSLVLPFFPSRTNEVEQRRRCLVANDRQTRELYRLNLEWESEQKPTNLLGLVHALLA